MEIRDAYQPVFIRVFSYYEPLKKFVFHCGNIVEDYGFEKTSYFSWDHPLILHIKRSKIPLELNWLKYQLEHTPLDQRNRESFFLLKELMQRMGIALCLPIFNKNKLFGFILLGEKLNSPYIYTPEDIDLLLTLLSYVEEAIQTSLLKEENIALILNSLEAIIQSVEAKDAYTGGHSLRVAETCYLLGEKLKDEYMEHIPKALIGLRRAALLHDVGKIAIPENILNKEDFLTEKEFELIKHHPEKGVEVVSPLKKWLGEDIILGILLHHENFDGSGYPTGAKETEIHIYARIIRVADTYDALITDRPYRPAYKKEKAVEEIKKFASIHFDPIVVKEFVELYKEGIIG
jgi:HD-GYP domain-containing protein (c-di-GMP phosphodiesterase class II)